MRDITLEDTFTHPFTTRAFATGIPTLLTGTPVISVLEEGNNTPITVGITLSVSRAATPGLNEVAIVATAANGYENLKSYAIYVSTGTVGGTSVVGEIVGTFTIGLSAAAILSAAVKLKTDFLPSVTAGANGGVFIAGVNAQTTVTTAFTSTFTGNLTGSVGSVTGHTPQTGDSFARLGAPVAASVSADIATVKADTVTIIARPTTAMTESYAAQGADPTPDQMLYMLWSSLSEFAITATTITAKRLNGSTTAMTFTVDNSVTPTLRTRAT